MSHPVPSHRVLPTLNNDGSRRWVRPKPFNGRYHTRRLIVAWLLIVLFAGLPFVRISGEPVVLLDIPGRKFVLFGATFLPTDGVLLMLLMLSIFIAIFLLTSLFGRVWCGWGCPQTVYMEFVFRPIERLLEGSRGQQLKLDREGPNARRILKLGIYAILSVLVANVFLAYFVGTDSLSRWVRQSPVEHPIPFLVVLGTSALVFFDFAYFREQMCTVICPYARLQSVLLDESSLIVGYDAKRGEPRGKGRALGGDCIDCKACVVTCPTGIDIREGLQLECIACTQCVDACDSVMKKIDKPPAREPPARPHRLLPRRGRLGHPAARPMTRLEAYAPPAEAAKPLSAEALEASLAAALAPWQPGRPFWIFGYGSLMWNPQFTWDARHVSGIRGYHRAFRVWSRMNRGTPENPGLVLTLDRGGSCRGLLYRIPAERVEEEMRIIWRREMTFGSYLPKWLHCVVGEERIPALCFTVNRQCSGYAGDIPQEVVVEAIACAEGRYGPACDYLFKTMETLQQHGIRDTRVEHLVQLVRARMRAA